MLPLDAAGLRQKYDNIKRENARKLENIYSQDKTVFARALYYRDTNSTYKAMFQLGCLTGICMLFPKLYGKEGLFFSGACAAFYLADVPRQLTYMDRVEQQRGIIDEMDEALTSSDMCRASHKHDLAKMISSVMSNV